MEQAERTVEFANSAVPSEAANLEIGSETEALHEDSEGPAHHRPNGSGTQNGETTAFKNHDDVMAKAPVNDFAPEPDMEPQNGDAQHISTPRPEDYEEESSVPQSLVDSKETRAMKSSRGPSILKASEEGITQMHKFVLYETAHRFYLIGSDILDERFRVLKIDRTAPPGHLNIFEDDILYDRREKTQLLNAIDDGNRGSGGMKLKCVAWGLIGFIRFTEAYYMLLITKRTQVAMIGGHYIYQIEGTELVPLTTGSTSRFQKDRNPEETRFLGILNNLDLTRSFYFSYSYNITRTLQHNIIREREALNQGRRNAEPDLNDMFVWNHYLLGPALDALKGTYHWCLPIIHGFIDQSFLDIFGRRVYITVIARRSRFFAGARFLKRGVNDLGYVANDVETEQIVSEVMTTSFHAPGPRLYASPTYTSYVQHRGSIPLFWTQDTSGVSPKPDIDLNPIDPFYSAGALHFDNLFERYGSPIYVVNLIKARERTPRESKLLFEFKNALDYLNQSLPEGKKILYKAFDMSRAAKTRGQDVIGELEMIAEDVLEKTGFFHNGDFHNGDLVYDLPTVQNGVARTNCIDCLDRTNAAQFVIGKRALGRQLQALGVIAGNTVEYDTDTVNIFTHMFHDHGDTIAVQYGGSHLVNTVETYRKINHWQGHSRDMVESFKRYYHNSFHDSQRQEAYNLFLGNYIFAQGQPMLWDLTTDFYLHHTDPREWAGKTRPNYIQWYTPAYLEPRTLPESRESNEADDTHNGTFEKSVADYDSYWLEYYKPLALSSFAKIFSYRMNKVTRHLPDAAHHDPSPFSPRKSLTESESPSKTRTKKGVTIVDPNSEKLVSRPSSAHDHIRFASTQDGPSAKQSILRDPHFETTLPSSIPADAATSVFKPADKALMHQWTLNEFHNNALNPSVTAAEAEEYERYISHPLNLPLVVSTETADDVADANLDFVEYLSSVSGDIGGVGGAGTEMDISEEDLADYLGFLEVPEDPLTVKEEDLAMKRYKAYRQWLRGKSLFKLSKVDPEYRAS
ncbi:hypothetical protein W97_00305 [Coniosporium apollinis CBS 100218]|uniref:SAC domain-containing protein n=1 Tax=Coniosporium apollinis (strain CBS 100218) TaxID=1168221 RepID=R7YH37_CONA1|nr:uncharacterized protein W97_00305 [Coniosporium apollinis CBS 100218]EON61094.1 hypothetical protein W97_00305 [Coniosporium apollinis CBS 100218]